MIDIETGVGISIKKEMITKAKEAMNIITIEEKLNIDMRMIKKEKTKMIISLWIKTNSKKIKITDVNKSKIVNNGLVLKKMR